MDDEYLQLVLLHGDRNNTLAQTHYDTKVSRAMSRKPAILALLYQNSREVLLDGEVRTVVDVDRDRIDQSFRQIAQGLHFLEYGSKWEGLVRIHIPILHTFESPEAQKVDELIGNLCAASRLYLQESPDIGTTPQVFTYRLKRDLEKVVFICQMFFYGGFEVIAASHPTQR